MAGNISMGWDYLQNSISNTHVLGQSWIIPLMLTVLILLVLTRDITKWAIYAFPVSLLLSIFGIGLPMIFIIILGIICFVSLLSTDGLARVIDSATSTSTREGIIKRTTDYARGEEKKEIRKSLRESALKKQPTLLSQIEYGKNIFGRDRRPSGFIERTKERYDILARDRERWKSRKLTRKQEFDEIQRMGKKNSELRNWVLSAQERGRMPRFDEIVSQFAFLERKRIYEKQNRKRRDRSSKQIELNI